MRDLSTIENRILDTTLYLIGKTGSFNVPIRQIAKEAEVNVGAINYYFKTKEEFMLYVKRFYIRNMLAAYDVLDHEDIDPEERLILASNEIMEYTLKYPGILIILKEARERKDKDETDREIMELTEKLNDKLHKTLEMVLGEKTDFEYNRMIFLSSILYPTIVVDLGSVDKKIIGKKEDRIEYIKYVLEKLK